MRYVVSISLTFIVVLTLIFPDLVLAQVSNTSVFYPDKDNTLIESSSGSFSNGAGPFLFSGRIGTQGDFGLRRAILRFDLSEAIPQHESILDGTLNLTVTRAQSNTPYTYTLHRMVKNWGEGTSTSSGGQGSTSSPEDATWIHAFYPEEMWDTPGGDFVETPSAQIEIGTEGEYVVENQDGLVEDLKFWHEHPELNFGWILIGNEDGIAFAVKQFGSRENTNPDARPLLEVVHEDPALPVELGGFDALVDENSVLLEWWTVSELNNAGFSVQKKSGDEFVDIGFVSGAGTTNERQFYNFRVTSLSDGLYNFRLKQIDFDGTFAYSPLVFATINHTDSPAQLAVFPTPFNPQTTIQLTLKNPQNVRIDVYDFLGRNVRQLSSGMLESGIRYTFQFEAGDLPSGTYFIRAQGSTFKLLRTVTLYK